MSKPCSVTTTGRFQLFDERPVVDRVGAEVDVHQRGLLRAQAARSAGRRDAQLAQQPLEHPAAQRGCCAVQQSQFDAVERQAGRDPMRAHQNGPPARIGQQLFHE